MKAIREARSIKDIQAVLGRISADLSVISDHTKALEVSVSSSVKISISNETIELGDLSRTTKNKGPSGVISDYKAPETKDLVKNSRELNRLAQKIAELESAKQVVLSDAFSPYADLQKKTVKSINDLVKAAARDRDRQVRAMAKIGRQHKPKEHVSFVKQMNSHIKKVLSEDNYSEILAKTFVLNPVADKIWYQTFIEIRDLVNDEGYSYDFYAVVVTAIIDLDTGEFQHTLTTVNLSRIPGSFDPGKPVASGAEAKRRINVFLAGENFVAKHGRKSLKGFPLSKTGDFRRSALPNSSEHVDGIRVQNGKIYVRLERGVDGAIEKKAIEDVRSILGILVRRREVDVKGKKYDRYLKDAITHRVVRGKKGRKWVEFVVIPSERVTKGEVTPKMLEEAVDRMVYMDGMSKADAQRAMQALRREFT